MRSVYDKMTYIIEVCLWKKIFGYFKNNRTAFRLKFDQIEETTVSSVCGKAVFDFLWIDESDFNTIFTAVATAFARGGVSSAMQVAAPFVDKNSYLTIYIATFIDFLADEKTADYFSNLFSSDFTLPQKGSEHYILKLINAIDYEYWTEESGDKVLFR